MNGLTSIVVMMYNDYLVAITGVLMVLLPGNCQNLESPIYSRFRKCVLQYSILVYKYTL